MHGPGDTRRGQRAAPTPPLPDRSRARLGRFLVVATAFVVGLMLRSTGWFSTFSGDGSITLGLDDAQFHARRALYSFINFPAVLEFDWFMAYPAGAPAPVPPLFDWGTAAVARLFGDDTRTFETVAAWVSPFLGALLVWPAYSIGRGVASAGVGLAAAWLVAILPSAILITGLGNFDHHGAVALLAAGWLASSMRGVGRKGRALALHSVLHSCIVTLMLFTWSGSLLYVALGAGAQLAAMLLLHGRCESLCALGASLLGSALLACAWLQGAQDPIGGPFSSQSLSWLHFWALLALAALALGLGAWERMRSSRGAPTRVLRAALLSGCLALPLLAVPEIREEVVQGLGFLGQQDVWSESNPEQMPLFHSEPERMVRGAKTRLGLFAYLVPLLPVYLGWRVFRARERERLLLLLVWVSCVGALLLSQVRYGTDFSVPGAVTFAMLLADIRRWLGRRIPAPVPAAIVAVLTLVCIWPFVARLHAPRLALFVQRWELRDTPSERKRLTGHQSAIRFNQLVRRVTPEVSGFLEASERPEYGILVPPSSGHRFTYTARRPVPANNLGPYLDDQKYQLARTFYRAKGPEEAVAAVDALAVRYVVTTARRLEPPGFADVLHNRNESTRSGRETTGRFRLVAQSPAEYAVPRASAAKQTPEQLVRHKLFEVVEGAVLVVDIGSRSLVRASLTLKPETGKPIQYETATYTGPDGRARLRVPYPTGSRGPVGTSSAWVVVAGEQRLEFAVDEADVREGREVHASAAGEVGVAP